jgi:hypothetical protein
MSRWSIVLLALAMAAPAAADVSAPARAARVSPELAAFQAFVHTLAQQHGQHVHDWWTVDLDGDGKLDFAAALGDEDQDHGDLILQHGKQRWDVRYECDGHTDPGCGPTDEPLPVEHLKQRGIDFRQAYSGGFHEWRFALRGGRLVIVREVSLGNVRRGDEEEVTDWDQRIAAGHARAYPRLHRYDPDKPGPGFGLRDL